MNTSNPRKGDLLILQQKIDLIGRGDLVHEAINLIAVLEGCLHISKKSGWNKNCLISGAKQKGQLTS